MNRHREGGRFLWPLGVCAIVALQAAIPLLRQDTFYFVDDTQNQFAPTWYHLGELLRDGQWPPWIDPGMWAGGNYAGEALLGIYNPLNPIVWLVVSGSSDLMIATYLVKLAALEGLALGTYLLCREYGASRWASAVLATALPVSGFTLYWDTAAWPGGLIAFAYIPWVWWAFRRVLHDRMNPFWAFLVGALAITQGNPYGVLGVVMVGVGLLVEAAVARRWRGAIRLLLVGACVAAFLPLVFLPLVEQADLAVRSTGSMFSNGGGLRPGLGDLFGLSSPTYLPDATAFGRPMRSPATYFAWFVLPLLPWLRYDVLRRRKPAAAGIAVVIAGYLLLTLGPTNLWLFRWPLRLVEYAELGLSVLLAVLLSEGLRTFSRGRLLATLGLLALAGWLTWSRNPQFDRAAYVGPLVLLALTGVLLAWHRWGPRRRAWLAAPLILGTGIVLAVQTWVFPGNANIRHWGYPTEVAAIQDRFGDLDGPLIQLAGSSPSSDDRSVKRPWRHYIGGSNYAVAGVDSVNSYNGMGYSRFNKTFCMRYHGFTAPCGGYARLWESLATGEPSLADLMQLQTVVATPKEAATAVPPEGWSVESEPSVVVLRRDEPLDYPDSRLSWSTADVESARSNGPYRDRVELGSGGDLVFGMLAWPGYEATLDGRPAPIEPNRAGLLTVEAPSAGTLEVVYRPPGLTGGLALAGLGTLGAALLGLVRWRRRRTERMRR